MFDLRSAVLKVAREYPETQEHLLPLVRKAGIPVPPDVLKFAEAVKDAAGATFPGGTFNWKASKSWGSVPVNDLFFQMTTMGEKDWGNGIIHNDPAMHQWWMHGSFTDDGFFHGCPLR